MSSIEPNWPALVWFTMLWVACCIGFLVVSGMFPLSRRPEDARRPGGATLVASNMLLLTVLVAGTWLYGWTELRGTSLIVFGGLVVLFTPALFEAWPAPWRDGRAGLGALVAVQSAALAALCGLAGADRLSFMS